MNFTLLSLMTARCDCNFTGSILVTVNPPVPLNPVSIFASWVPLSSTSVTGYRVTARSRVPPARGQNRNYTANVNGSDSSNYTFTNLSPNTYDEGDPGIVYSISVSALGTGDQVLGSSIEVNTTIPRELTISFTYSDHHFFKNYMMECNYPHKVTEFCLS